MSAVATRSTTKPTNPGAGGIPRLQNGDRLTRAEFERRYRAMPQIRKAELIEGVVYMPSPVRYESHSHPHALLVTWLGYYLSKSPGLLLADNGTNRLDEDNEPQPDVMLLLPEQAGGSATLDEDDYISGAPELVCEVAASSVSIDMHAKLNAYRRNSVKEYLVWRVDDGAIDWFVLREGRYDMMAADAAGRIRSTVFPGLSLDVAAMLAGDLTKVFAAVDAEYATAEHGAFLQTLAKASQ